MFSSHAKRKVLKFYNKDGYQFELHFFIFSLILNRFPSFFAIQFIVTCLSHKNVNFGDIFSVLIIRFVKIHFSQSHHL